MLGTCEERWQRQPKKGGHTLSPPPRHYSFGIHCLRIVLITLHQGYDIVPNELQNMVESTRMIAPPENRKTCDDLSDMLDG